MWLRSLPFTLTLIAFLAFPAQCRSVEQANGTSSKEEEPATLAESSWNSTHQNPLITAVTLKTVNGFHLDFVRTETIFDKGHLIGKWASCEQNSTGTSKCPLLPLYEDRVFLSYTHDADRAAEYSLSPPSIKALKNRAHPTVADFDYKEGTASFTVLFNCERREEAGSTEMFELGVPILRNFSIVTRFTKECRSGRHPYLQFGIKHADREVLISNSTGVVAVAAMEQTTDLLLRVVFPADSIIHGKPTLTSSNKLVGVKLRGITDTASVVRKADMSFGIIYDCFSNEQTNVSLTIPIPPWDDLKLQLRKSCGGGAPHMLEIGTATGLHDVVTHGVPNPEYALTTGPGYAEGGRAYVVGRNTTELPLYIRNSNDAGAASMYLGRLHATVSDGDIVHVVLLRSDGAELGVVRGGAEVAERVHFVCLKEGRGMVVFSLPVLGFDLVEFCVTKECVEPRAVQGFGWEGIWTVEFFEDVVFVVGVAAVVGCCLRCRGKREIAQIVGRGSGYERVAAG